MDDKKLLAQALGYYLKAHVNKDDKMAECFPEKWASEVDLQLAFKKGWKEAEDEQPVQMTVTMDLTRFVDELKKEMRELRGEMERMLASLKDDDDDTDMVHPGVYVTEIDKTILKPDYYVVKKEDIVDVDIGSHAPGRHAWEAATGKTLDDFALFYKIGPRAPGEEDWQLRMRIKYAHEFQHPGRYPGLPLEPKYTGLDVVDVKCDADGNISGVDYFDEPGIDYNKVESEWRAWQDANKKAFSEKEAKAIQVHNVIQLDGEAIAKAINEYQKGKVNK